jgi:hypothetical protein
VYILCDLVEYSEVNQHKVQLLDYFYSAYGIKSEGRAHYVKLLNKRFRTINIDVKADLPSEEETAADLKNKIFVTDKEGEQVTCFIHFRRIG